jgi:predicted unusual protein kinase regulating ubiquinone biosynthesis (AarF/ABC1/UbiB family)
MSFQAITALHKNDYMPVYFVILVRCYNELVGGFMNKSELRLRYWRITFFFARLIASFIGWEILLKHLGFRKWVRQTRSKRFRDSAVRFRKLAIRMGGVMIKVGQFLSARLDILPAEVTDELSGLQDEVPPEDFSSIRKLAESELGGKFEDKFAYFDSQPLAAASLGQVHRARLREDTPDGVQFLSVVVKIQRPFIDQLIEVDLSALRRVAGWLMHYRPIREHADIPALLQEFTTTLREEVDYIAEGGNADRFREKFKDDSRVHVPRVVWSLTTRRVLTLEDVYAIKITDYSGITDAGIDRGAVAAVLLDTYLKQIFEDGFFHADPHPGNLFVTPAPEGSEMGWQLTFVDFGMVGRVPDELRNGLREAVIAIGTRDAARIVKAYQQLGILLPGADLKLIEQAESAIFDRFWGMSMKEIRQVKPEEFRDIGHRFRDLMLEMPFQVPNNLLMLVRTVFILSGMCTGLDQDFNLWVQLSPYAAKLVADEATSNLNVWMDELGEMLKVLLSLPGQSSRVLAQAEAGNLIVQVPHMTRQVEALGTAVNRLTGSVFFVGLLLGGVSLYNAGNLLFGEAMLVASLVALLWTLFFAK